MSANTVWGRFPSHSPRRLELVAHGSSSVAQDGKDTATAHCRGKVRRRKRLVRGRILFHLDSVNLVNLGLDCFVESEKHEARCSHKQLAPLQWSISEG
jgi:hypothetical protein